MKDSKFDYLNRPFVQLTRITAVVFALLFCLSAHETASASPSADSEIASPPKQVSPFSIKNKPNLSSQSIAVSGFDAGFTTNITEGSSQAYGLAVQPDGKFLVGGNFTSVDGVKHNSLERFNADGTRDATFNPGGAGANGIVYVINVLASGKIMIGGSFNGYNGINAPRIARLNADGTLDTTFTAQGTSTNAGIQDMIMQSDGKFLICGNFTNFNGVVRNRVARLNADGTLDTAFNPNANGFVEELILQPDGKIIIGGIFTTVGGVARISVARLNTDGTVDTSFNPGTSVGTDGAIYAAERQSDGKILIGGAFNIYNGTPRQNVARLNTDGSLDTSFNSNTGGNGVEFFAVQPDGKIVAVGSFAFSNAAIVRLNTDGGLDSSFNGGTADDTGYVVTLQSDGKILLGGFFTQYAGNPRQNVARLNANGTADSFAAGIAGDPIVRAIIQQSDGKILVGGQFRKANGVARRNLARFNLDGTLDTTFDPANNFGGFNAPSVYSIAVEASGKILVGGNFSIFYGNARNYLSKLNPDGSLDTGFFFNDASVIVRDIEVLPDGKILLGGYFQNENISLFTGIVRILSDGSYDVFATGTNNLVLEIKPLADGKAMIMGSFTTYNGVSRNRIARINPDFSLDTTFNPGTGANSTVYDVALLPSGQMYVGGFFSSFNGQANTNDIVRLSANGTVDTSFNSGLIGFNGGIYSLLLQPDSKILVGGNFNSYNEMPLNELAQLNPNGTLDTSFSSPLNTDIFNFVNRLYRQSNGKILVGGGFTSPRNAVIRLGGTRTPFDFDGDGKTDIGIFRPSAGEWWYSRSSDGQVPAVQFGNSNDKPVPADFTGDGKADIAFWRPSSGEWFILRSEDASFLSFAFGTTGDVPVVSDFDGDGKADPGVFRPSSNEWFILKSTGGTLITTFGTTGDVPVVADYDGDGKADIAIFRPSDGSWWYVRSSDGQFRVYRFGVGTDKPVQGDYTGDGKADIAVFRPSTGEWFFQRSEDGSFYSVPFGASGDLPTPGDYDGDGKFDTAIFRPNGSTWFIQRSTAGTLITNFGITGDRPLPNVFVP